MTRRSNFEEGRVRHCYSEVRYRVMVESDAPEAEILRVLNQADARDPYLDVFRRAQPCRREVRIKPAAS